jgi:CheY-like chemotaxis protein
LDEETAPLPHMAGHEWVEMKVADTGTGIPPDVLPHIFDPFTSTKAPGKGTGLGLAQVHGIVEQHAGHIEVDTEIGEGTTFTIYLSAAPEAADEKIFISSQALVHGEQELILVVEDNPETRAALKHSLKQLNYRVFETHNGREALTVWEEHREEIKVVLSDVVMPEMGGIDLFFGLIEQDEAVKVVLVTGHLLAEHMDHQMEHLKARGLVGWLKKPYSLERLAQILALALGKGDPKLH